MQDKANLEHLLREMYETMSELSLALDEEYTALSTQDFDKLQQAAVRKETLSDKVEQLESTRTHMLKAAGLKNDLVSMQKLIHKSNDNNNNALLKIWNMVAELAEESAKKNKTNGMIIEAKRRHNATALAILQGQQPDNSELYDADGAKVQTQKNSTIARA